MIDISTSDSIGTQGSSAAHFPELPVRTGDLQPGQQKSPSELGSGEVDISQFAQVKMLNHQGVSVIHIMQRTGLDEKTITEYIGYSVAPIPDHVVTSDTIDISQIAHVKLLSRQGSSIIEIMNKTGLDNKTITDYLGHEIAS